MTIVFVLVFVLLGLGVVAAAMRSGRRPAADGPGRGARRAGLTAFGVVLVVVGLGVPALVMVANAEDQSKQGPGGVELSDAQADGQEIFARNCAICHTLGGANAVGKVGPNLDVIRPPKNLTLDAIAKGRARGQGQMPARLVTGADAQDVADYVAAVAGR